MVFVKCSLGNSADAKTVTWWLECIVWCMGYGEMVLVLHVHAFVELFVAA